MQVAPVTILSRKLNKPSQKDWTECKRILRYLKLTQYNKLKLGNENSNLNLCGYTDSDWGSDTEVRKSTGGFFFVQQWSDKLVKQEANVNCIVVY